MNVQKYTGQESTSIRIPSTACIHFSGQDSSNNSSVLGDVVSECLPVAIPIISGLKQIVLKNLKKLLENNNIEGQDFADAHAMLTQAYLNIQAKDSAIVALKKAISATKIKEERARYRFILGQLYESAYHKDSAFAAFESVIQMKRNAPRRYVIQAKIKQAQQFDYKKGDTLLFVEAFQKLLEDRENRPYLDALYHQMGVFYDQQNQNASARKFYNKSLKKGSNDNYLVASNYRNLAEIYFRTSKYSLAGKYYDSTLVKLKERTREYRKIKKKRLNLDDVIKYETIAQQNDSILAVVALDEAGQKRFYENYIEENYYFCHTCFGFLNEMSFPAFLY
jgi:tetratricopeptide (TPR) repeat protein